MVDLHQTNLQLYFFLFNSVLLLSPTPNFLGFTFDRTTSFFAHLSLVNSNIFSRLKALPSIFVSLWSSPRSPFLFFTKLFSSLFYLAFYPDGFHFSALPTLPIWNTLTEQPIVALSSDAYCPPPYFFFSQMHFFLLYESP